MSLRTWSGARLSLTLLAWECLGVALLLGVWGSAPGREWLVAHVIRGRATWVYLLFGPPVTLFFALLWLALPLSLLVAWLWVTRSTVKDVRHAAV